MKVIVVTDDCNEFLGLAKNTQAIKKIISKHWDDAPVNIIALADGTLTAEVFHTDIGRDEGDSGIWDYRFWEEDIIE